MAKPVKRVGAVRRAEVAAGRAADVSKQLETAQARIRQLEADVAALKRQNKNDTEYIRKLKASIRERLWKLYEEIGK